ncbi:C-type lectin domain-containing protein [Maribacter sp. 2307ULW6-5]|uniref:C-type lectin domain-containing protein n=1 Tax=Maribacter sp. 2307ULW6-5 TaxID=3386275 RepID=UPI0039BD0234
MMNSKPIALKIKWKGTFAALLLFLSVPLPTLAQTTIWSEDFSLYPNGTLTGTGTGTSSAGWTSQTGAAVLAGQLWARDTRNAVSSSLANPVVWATGAIDISTYTNVSLSLDTGAISSGSLDDSGGAQDNFTLQYRINTGAWTQVFSRSGSFSQPIAPSYSVNGLSGNSLELRALFHNTANNEIYTLDNVLVTGVPAPANQPPVLTATGSQTYCPGTSLPIAQSIVIADPDDTGTNAVYIQISSGYVNGEDLLSLTGSHPNISASWDAAQGKLTLTGPASYTEFEAAVMATQFSSSAPNPSGTRQFSITVGEPNYLPSTQHYYEFVPDAGITWSDALTAAANRTYFGLQGYLVTLTSQEEADFAGAQASGFGWIGATDEVVEGQWRWASGPEQGTLFWTGLANGTEITYANWNGGEPNNVGSNGEDYAHIAAASVIRGGAPIGAWNDLPNRGGGGAYASQGYVVEYGGMPGDPVLNITATTSITMDNLPPTWVTLPGALDENYQCASEVPALAPCTGLNTTFFNENQFSWGFGLQNTTGSSIPNWEVRISNANYQLVPSQLSNPSAFTYSEIDNGDGTYDLILSGTGPIAPWSGIPGGNIAWPGVNFGFNPTSGGIAVLCGSVPFVPPVATDNCTGVTVSQIGDVVTVNNSPNDLVRIITYQAQDASGNTSAPFVKTITVNDTTAPTASDLPAVNVFCTADVPAPDVLAVNDEADNCAGPLTVTHLGDSSDGQSNPETITRTYRVADGASNVIDVTQTITVSGTIITVQPPTPVSGYSGNVLSFGVTAVNADTYQWQVSSDGGTSFVNLADGTDYTGTQGPALTITAAGATTAKNGYIYRVLVSNSAASCPPIVSEETLLGITPPTVISNRRITHRVRPD